MTTFHPFSHPRDRNIPHRGVPLPLVYRRVETVLDKRCNSCSKRESTLLFTVIPGYASTIGDLPGFLTGFEQKREDYSLPDSETGWKARTGPPNPAISLIKLINVRYSHQSRIINIYPHSRITLSHPGSGPTVAHILHITVINLRLFSPKGGLTNPD